MFTVLTLITPAIGIGANTAIFSVLNGVLLKPLPFRDPDRLELLWPNHTRAAHDGPRTLTIKSDTPRCSSPGTRRATFTFPASDSTGTTGIKWIEGVFSISPTDATHDADGVRGPDSGAQGCHFYYDHSTNTVYLDGPNGGYAWVGSSSVGPAGIDLANPDAQSPSGYCVIHAGSILSQVTTDPVGPNILNLTLDIEFPPSTSSTLKKHIYTITGDYGNATSDIGKWKYWGWWSTP